MPVGGGPGTEWPVIGLSPAGGSVYGSVLVDAAGYAISGCGDAVAGTVYEYGDEAAEFQRSRQFRDDLATVAQRSEQPVYVTTWILDEGLFLEDVDDTQLDPVAVPGDDLQLWLHAWS
jgi:hypothetical protein